MRLGRPLVFGVTAVLLIAACGSDDDSESRAKAEQFVDAVHAGGLAPRLNVDTAEALYGDDAPAVCEAFDGDLSTSALNALLGNFAQRRKSITDDAVGYGRIVVETYCPDNIDQFDDVVADVEAIEKNP
jgi:hypothetical protein